MLPATNPYHAHSSTCVSQVRRHHFPHRGNMPNWLTLSVIGTTLGNRIKSASLFRHIAESGARNWQFPEYCVRNQCLSERI